MLRRSPNWSPEESDQLTVSIEKRRKILCNSTITHTQKFSAWEEVSREVSALGNRRCVKEVKKKWSQLKMLAKAKAMNLQREYKTDLGSLPEGVLDLSDSESRILSIIENVLFEEDVNGEIDSIEIPQIMTQSDENSKADKDGAPMNSDESNGSMHEDMDAEAINAKVNDIIAENRKVNSDKGLLNKRSNNQDFNLLVNLQEQTLDAVQQLVRVQTEILKVEQERLAVEKTRLTMQIVESSFEN